MLDGVISTYKRVSTLRKEGNFFTTFYFFLLLAWCLYLNFWRTTFYYNLTPVITIQKLFSQGIVVAILLFVFIAIYKNRLSQTLAFLTGCIAMLVCGGVIGFYDLTTALQSVNIDTLSLLFGIGLISVVLAESNIFDWICRRVLERFGTSNFALFTALCLLTYFISFFVNNLTTILLVLPITATIAKALKLNVMPFVAGEIIASNLGGASSMLGDFPNMLIATQMNVPFFSFIQYMMPICLINLAIMFGYFHSKVDFGDHPNDKATIKLPDVKIKNQRELRLQLAIFALMIVLFMFSTVHAGLLALCGGFSIFLLSSNREEIVRKFRHQDIRFYFLLFVLVGGVKASGLPQTVASALSYFSGGSSFIQCVLLMWAACGLTMFLNAGPTTALFLPIFLGASGAIPDKLIFWALSLGVCAGSSGSLTGATAGPVAFTFMERFEGSRRGSLHKRTFKEYLQYGLPIAYVQLMVSTIYITILFLVRR